MAELVQMIQENVLAERADNGEDETSPVLNSGASEDQIAALEKRLSASHAEGGLDDTFQMNTKTSCAQVTGSMKTFSLVPRT
jgi:hypothetical protein